MSDDDRKEDDVEVEESDLQDMNEECCDDGSCGCEKDVMEKIEELQEEVETLRIEVDYLVDRMNVGTLIDYEE